MANCYWCGCEITKENISEEHIIKQSFGGVIYSTKLLCRKHNSELGNSLDSDFSKEMDYIAIALNLNIKNIHKKFVRMFNEEGKEVWVGPGLKALSYIILKKGDKEIKIPNIPDEDLEAQANKKKKELEKNGDGIYEFKEVELPPTYSTLYFYKDKRVGFGSDSYHLGFLKIAIGFALHNNIKRKFLDHAIDVLKDKLKDFKITKFFYSSLYRIETEKDQIIHFIYVRGDQKNRLLYCYIELFSTHKMLVFLNSEYDGEEIEAEHCYDLLNEKVLEKKFSMNLSRNHYEDFQNFSYLNNEKEHEQLNNRLNNIIEARAKERIQT